MCLTTQTQSPSDLAGTIHLLKITRVLHQEMNLFFFSVFFSSGTFLGL